MILYLQRFPLIMMLTKHYTPLLMHALLLYVFVSCSPAVLSSPNLTLGGSPPIQHGSRKGRQTANSIIELYFCLSLHAMQKCVRTDKILLSHGMGILGFGNKIGYHNNHWIASLVNIRSGLMETFYKMIPAVSMTAPKVSRVRLRRCTLLVMNVWFHRARRNSVEETGHRKKETHIIILQQLEHSLLVI